MTVPAPDHVLAVDETTVHYDWDRSLSPVLTVQPGAVVQFECRDASDGHVGRDATVEDVRTLEFSGHPLTGPVRVEGAEPGDTLVVDVLDVRHQGYGFTYCRKGVGLLSGEFDAALHVWDLEGDVGHFVNGIEVPLDPFPGILGVAPAEAGVHSTVPPRRVGGNLDIKHLTAGSTLYLPVAVEGALFSTGDCHAAQGDGEVSVTGIEIPATVTLRFDVLEESSERPWFETTGPFGRSGPTVGTTGVAPALETAVRQAVAGMLDVLEARGLTRSEAYLLCSAVVDLKINEVVNEPNYVVSAYLPESIFPGDA